MALNLGLQVRQTQGLVLTPQLQQAIKLLQYSHVELQELVQRELADNPFLRLAEPAERPAAAAATGTAEENARSPRPSGGEEDVDGWPQPPVPAAADARLTAHGRVTRATDEPRLALEQRFTRPPSLQEHLRFQLGADVDEPRLRAVALSLVDHLDEDGYLREADGELAARLGVEETLVARARAALQRCDPTGVGARDLRECLALQLAERDRLDPLMARFLEHLDLVARADFGRLLRLLGTDREDLEQMIAEIRALDPRPGSRFATEEPATAIPDLFVYRFGRQGWRVELNTAVLPRVLVDKAWYAELSSTKLDRAARDYIGERMQSANWLVRSLQQRARTILRVGRAVFERQRPFLERGPAALRPLVLREIAAVLDLHESTVSRAVAGKYVGTPHGTFPFRYFFSTGLAGDNGENVSAESIRLRIRRLIEQEEPGKVLSDDRIVGLLRREGITVARRTVAKYREALGIPSSVERRRLKALAR